MIIRNHAAESRKWRSAPDQSQPTTRVHIGDEVLALQNPEFTEAREQYRAEFDKARVSLPKIEDLVDRQIWSGDLGIDKAGRIATTQ